MWTGDDKNETETTEQGEEKTLEVESEITDEIDTLLDYVPKFEARRTKELAAKAEEKKRQLRHLIGVIKLEFVTVADTIHSILQHLDSCY